VELPGIESSAYIGLTCEVTEADDAKARETTPNFLRKRPACWCHQHGTLEIEAGACRNWHINTEQSDTGTSSGTPSPVPMAAAQFSEFAASIY